MGSAETWTLVLIAATALHAGFQLTVTLVVYPALASVPTPSWPAAHDAHSRRIAPVVVVVYGAALPIVVGAVAVERSLGAAVACAATVAAVLVTATSAAPIHARLANGRDDDLVRRLLRADRWRCLAALIAFGGALLVAL